MNQRKYDFSLLISSSSLQSPSLLEILQTSPATAALLTVSQDRLLSNQYLRVTLKSVFSITGFIIQAVDQNNEDNKGNIDIILPICNIIPRPRDLVPALPVPHHHHLPLILPKLFWSSQCCHPQWSSPGYLCCLLSVDAR